MLIRPAAPDDVHALHDLYMRHLTKTPPPEPQDLEAWSALLAELTATPGYRILVAEEDGRAVSSVTLVVIRNLTHNLRPYALIENVVTHADYRGRGFASALMNRACEMARDAGCYKVMLLTGSKSESTLRFYERRGFNKNDKTGFIRWL